MTGVLRDILDRAGVFQYGIVDPREAEFTLEARKYCEDNACGRYGKTWACPPAVGTTDECRERARRYDRMLVFSCKFGINGREDYSGMRAGLKDFKETAGRLGDELRPYLKDYLPLCDVGGCDNCEKCSYPDPCRFPGMGGGSVESWGIYADRLARLAGIRYDNGADTITYFGAILFNGDVLL